MDFDALAQSSLVVQFHVANAMIALICVPLIVFARKGTSFHKNVGRIWTGTLALTALSSFGIMDIRLIGPFSPIHGLSLLTLYSLIRGIAQARAKSIERHKGHMQGAMMGLIGAAIFTVVPHRLMSKTLFPSVEWGGFIGALLFGVIVFGVYRVTQRPVRAGSSL